MKGMLQVGVLATVALIVAAGCQPLTAPVVPAQGAIYSKIRAPLTIDFHRTPVCAKSGSVKTFYVYEPLMSRMDFAWGDASIQAAAQAGNLTTVEYADYEMLRVLGVFGRFTVTAYGQ